MSYELLQGDCIEVMRTLPSGSVQCCVTSPPYYGLRDYGTAAWEGGAAECDHRMSDEHAHAHYIAAPTLGGGKGNQANGGSKRGFGLTCGKCGARRIDQQIGLEETPEAYIAKLVEVFREVRRLLRDDGVLWLNLGDSYANFNHAPGGMSNGYVSNHKGAMDGIKPHSGTIPTGCKPKDLIGIPWMVAFALRADGWWLRSEVIWHKRAPMPESVTDRPTKAHEQVFLLSKAASYYYDADAIAEDATSNLPVVTKLNSAHHDSRAPRPLEKDPYGSMGYMSQGKRNRRSVWTLGPESYSGAHFATMPTKLVEPCILAGSRVGDTVLDPFNGSGTTGAVALKHHRNYIGIDLNADYLTLAHDRIRKSQPMLLEVT